jgi:hypothetical protein
MDRSPPPLDLHAEIERLDRLRAKYDCQMEKPVWPLVAASFAFGAMIFGAGMVFAKYVL